jgi:hypothetical protein
MRRTYTTEDQFGSSLRRISCAPRRQTRGRSSHAARDSESQTRAMSAAPKRRRGVQDPVVSKYPHVDGFLVDVMPAVAWTLP